VQGVFTDANEDLELQILFDRLEKQPDLPAMLWW
jgi:hypothetical protein